MSLKEHSKLYEARRSALMELSIENKTMRMLLEEALETDMSMVTRVTIESYLEKTRKVEP